MTERPDENPDRNDRREDRYTMCTDTDTKKHRITDAHRQAALALFARLEAMAEIRDTYDAVRARHDENTRGLDEIEEMIDHEADRIADEARALGIFEDEYECECDCAERDSMDSYDDEEQPRRVNEEERREPPTDGEAPNQWPPYIASLLRRRRERSAPRAPGVAEIALGAIGLGVGYAVAELASRWLDEDKD